VADPRVTVDPRTPVIVGAAQLLHRDGSGEEPLEPATLMVQALRGAADDSGAGEGLLRGADSLRCVPVIGWRYDDVASVVAEDLGVQPRETVQSALIGGDGPQVLVNDTARAIASGQIDVALIAGGEAIGSVRVAELSGGALAWRHRAGRTHPTRTLEEERAPVDQAEAAVGLALPVYTYALIEGAVRHAAARPRKAHLAMLAELWSRLSAVAARNPHAWISRAYTAQQIAAPTPDNRLVAEPYTKLLTANIRVNMATGLAMASAEAARLLGVPRDRWVFLHSGAQAQDRWFVGQRHELHRSPAIAAVGRAALGHAGVTIDEIAHVDLYSCFPSAVQVAAREIGLALDDAARAPTLTGGLTFAGGPGNNYTSHAIATLVPLLRDDPDAYGLTTAVGWYLTKHALGVYGGHPPRKPFASLDPEPRHGPARPWRTGYLGPATLETYTLAYDRDGSPDAAILSALTPTGERVLTRSTRRDVIDAMLNVDRLGAGIELGADGDVAFS
jgi:acetyl-CoA C-acetyltransferase